MASKKDARERLIEDLLEYESDTFSASGYELTRKKAEMVADKLIDRWKDHLDGISISEILEG